MLAEPRSSRDWFYEAERCYMENHQGCAWCEGSYRVFLFNEGQKIVYFCQTCDFRAVRNPVTNAFHHIPGEKMQEDQFESLYAI